MKVVNGCVVGVCDGRSVLLPFSVSLPVDIMTGWMYRLRCGFDARELRFSPGEHLNDVWVHEFALEVPSQFAGHAPTTRSFLDPIRFDSDPLPCGVFAAINPTLAPQPASIGDALKLSICWYGSWGGIRKK